VDAADYVTWRKNGANGPLPNDDGSLTQAERYAFWVAHFGQTSSGGGSGGQLAAVPEPATAWLLLFAATAGLFARRTRT
jgi:hypothetical protein